MAHSAEDRFLEIGRIGKARGLNGVLRFFPNNRFTEGLFDRHKLFHMKNRRSDLIPVRLEHVHIESKKKKQLFFVKFDMIASRSDAEDAMNRALFIEAEHLDEHAEIDDEESLIGYEIQYHGKPFGEVLDVMENPAHLILQVKHEIGALLIPLVDEFVQETDHHNRMIICRNLDQLTDL